MAKLPVPSTEDLAAILIGHGIVDFVSGGRLTRVERDALWKIMTKTLPRLAIGTGKVAGRSAIGAALPIVTNPYIAGAALGYGALQTQPGQQLLEAAEDRGRMDRIRLEQLMTNLTEGTKSKVRKTKSKFNKMVSAGMKKLKGSTSYGKKGVINAPKKAFKAVTQAASAVTKKKKLPKSGIKRILMQAMRRI